MVGFLLIGVGTYAKTSSVVVTLPVVGGIVACGVFLLFVAILGLIATMKHHQVMLFFYMMILFAIFVIQFSVACACIGFSEEQEQDLAVKAWKQARDHEPGLIKQTETFFQCCGYNKTDQAKLPEWERLSCIKSVPRCSAVLTRTTVTPITPAVTQESANNTKNPAGGRQKRDLVTPDCPTCKSLIDTKIDKGFNAVGGLGLFFSLTELVILVVTYRFRKQIQESTQIA
jgi:tetraspanin-13/31